MKEFFVDVDDSPIQFFRMGKGTNKLVILHGWNQNMNLVESYKPLVDELSKYNFLENFEIIIPYFPGFGKNKAPEKGWNTNDYAGWLRKFLKKIDITSKNKVTFFSHSFGGRVLVRFLLKNPDFCKKAIFTASAGIKWPMSFRQKISIYLSKKCTKAKKVIPQKIQKIILNKILGARDWGAVKTELKPTLKKVLDETDFRDDLPKIKTETLIIWGALDQVTPLKSGEVFANKLPNAKIKIFPNGKHGIHITHTKEMTKELIKFLK